MKNIVLKLFSLVIAALLFYYVNSESNEGDITISVPVELKGVPANKTVLWPQSRQIKISIKGPSFLLPPIYTSPPPFRVKVPSDVGNKFTAVFKKSEVVLPPSVKVIGIDPPEMEFTFDDLVRKEVGVKVTQVGVLREGLKLDEMKVSPEKITITGPKTEVSDIQWIETDPIDFREVAESVERELALRQIGRLADVSANQVSVRLTVSSVNAEKRFDNMAIEVRSVGGESVTLSPQTVSVEVSGAKEKLSGLNASDIIVYVKLAPPLSEGTALAVFVDLPKGIDLVAADPPQVKIVKLLSAEENRVKTSKPPIKGKK